MLSNKVKPKFWCLLVTGFFAFKGIFTNWKRLLVMSFFGKYGTIVVEVKVSDVPEKD
ncbi:hypothetical protein SAMN05518847_102631 [Paenibacillus sp. OV219]|nr:hypothetical protein SAMN05518847_102631 [Paenibacillus sp. OV219]